MNIRNQYPFESEDLHKPRTAAVILKDAFSLDTALSCRHRTIFLELCCQAMVRPAAETVHTTEMLWRDQEEKWEEGGVWTFLLPPTVRIEILELT